MCDSLINPLDLECLVQRIRDGRCVPFWGLESMPGAKGMGMKGLRLERRLPNGRPTD